MDAQDNEPTTPKLEGEEAPRRGRGRPPKPKPEVVAETSAPAPATSVATSEPETTFWLKARKSFHISEQDLCGIDPDVASTSRGLAAGERCEVKDNKRTRGLVSSGLADEA